MPVVADGVRAILLWSVLTVCVVDVILIIEKEVTAPPVVTVKVPPTLMEATETEEMVGRVASAPVVVKK